MTDRPPPSTVEDSAAPMTDAPPAQQDALEEDSDPDFDDLDGTFSHSMSLYVLDQFSANAPARPNVVMTDAKLPSQPVPTASGPGRPDTRTAHLSHAPTSPSKPEPTPPPSNDPSEEEFMARLNAEMSALMESVSDGPADKAVSPEKVHQMAKELAELTGRMENEGIKMDDLLRAVIGPNDAEKVEDRAGDMAMPNERGGADGKRESASRAKVAAAAAAAAAGKSTTKETKTTTTAAGTTTTFDDTIRRTMERMSTSDATATNATSQSANSDEDMLAQLLKAMETEGQQADGEGGDLSKMFLGMMEQLTNKDMLYEPMKELNEKFPAWLQQKETEGKLAAEDMKRFRNQSKLVKEIVDKFEESSYSDDDPPSRQFIWDRMQQMQDEGSPPEDLVANPVPGMGGLAGLGPGPGPGDASQDAGCPTQ